jgi:predicted site-specific integrase-resolvase
MFVHRVRNLPGKIPKHPQNQLHNYGAKVKVQNKRLFLAMKIGYARVSTDAQETHLQMDALKRAKCARIYEEKASGTKAERPESMRLLDNARKGDVIIVWKLDRLARSLRQLIDTTGLLNQWRTGGRSSRPTGSGDT